MKTQEHADNSYDVIVIGSGMGGMTAASILSQLYNKRVLIVEKHWTFGGLTHEFSRGKNSWDVGLHYIGKMAEGETTRKLFDFVTGSGVILNRMPERYDNFVFPGFRFSFSASEQQTIHDLVQAFPAEEKAIRQYYRDIRKVRQYFGFYMAIHNFMPGFLRPLLKAYQWVTGVRPDVTLQTYLDRHFTNERLKGTLSGIWGDYGALPKDASLLIHAILTDHYIGGAYYPEGGASVIGENARKTLEANGATVLLNTEVTEIMVEQKKAVGIRVKQKNGTEAVYYAKHIISNAGAEVTYNRLLKNIDFSTIRSDIHKLENPNAFVSLYLTFKQSPAKLGFNGSNVWHFESTDQNRNVVSVHDTTFPAMMYLSFPTLKGHPSPQHTVDILTIVPYADVAEWQNQPWMKRGEAYNELKEKIKQKILAKAESLYPGFCALVESCEISTPLSLEFFTSRRMGATYGLLATPERFNRRWLKPQTPIKNLYLSGQDVCVCGIVGAMMGGVCGAAAVLGSTGFFDIMGKVMRRKSTAKPTSTEIDKKQQPTVPNKVARIGVSSWLEVRNNGHSFKVPVRAGQTLLQAAEEHDQALKHSCGTGVCGTCKVKLLEGEVVHVEAVWLSKAEEINGYVLPCCAYPMTEQVTIAV